MKKKVFVMLLAGLVIQFAGLARTEAVNIVVPVLVGSSNLNSFSTGTPDNLTNNDGMTPAVNNGDSLASAQAATHAFNGGFAESWVTNASGADYFTGFGATNKPTFVWDLGENVQVNNALLWQYQNNGGNGTSIGNDAKTVEFKFNAEGDGSAVFAGPAITIDMLNVAQLGGTNSAQTFGLDDTFARFVQMTILDNHRGTSGVTGGGDRVGLGEVRFDVTIIPEPATATLGLLSLVGITLRRRRTA